jgi:folate/biopterin transporter
VCCVVLGLAHHYGTTMLGAGGAPAPARGSLASLSFDGLEAGNARSLELLPESESAELLSAPASAATPSEWHSSLAVAWPWWARDAAGAPRAVAGFYARLAHAFGWRFVAIVSIVYGINQGMGEEWFGTATTYYFSDQPPKGLGLQPDRMASIEGFANVPWQVKAMYGMVSDTVPVGGLHREPYILMAGLLGLCSWSALWLLPWAASLAGVWLFLGNLSIASPDVMIDASVAERSKTHPRLASDLQTLCWVSFGIGKILSAASSGWLYDAPAVGSRGLFGLTALTSLVVLVPARLGWLGERQQKQNQIQIQMHAQSDQTQTQTHTQTQTQTQMQPRGGGDSGCAHAARRLCDAFREAKTAQLYRLALLVLAISMSLGLVANASESDPLIFALAMIASALVCAAVYALERDISMRLAKASLFIFLSGVVQPSSPLIFYWARQNEENCKPERNRPCFSPEFLSVLSVVGYVVFLLGTSLYNKYFSAWSYKAIWTYTQLLLAAVGFVDLVFVMRWNIALGLPDKLFMIGDEVIGDLVSRINSMPLFVLAAAVCPDGVEATLFAMNMSLSNFGRTIGGYTGVGLMWMLGGINAPEFNNLPAFIVLRSLARLLPILLIPLLVPDGSPTQEGHDADQRPTAQQDHYRPAPTSEPTDRPDRTTLT